MAIPQKLLRKLIPEFVGPFGIICLQVHQEIQAKKWFVEESLDIQLFRQFGHNVATKAFHDHDSSDYDGRVKLLTNMRSHLGLCNSTLH